MGGDQRPVWIKAFVGRSFLTEDEAVWNEIRRVLVSLRSFGLAFEDASEPQPRPISQKIREGIERNDLYLGIFTRRFPIYPDREDQTHDQKPQKNGGPRAGSFRKVVTPSARVSVWS